MQKALSLFEKGPLSAEVRSWRPAVGYFNAKIERYPDYLGRLILWVTAQALYGVREHHGQDPRRIILASWL